MAYALRSTYGTANSLIQTGVSVVAGDLIVVCYSSTNSLLTSTCADNDSGGSNTYNQVGTGIAGTGIQVHMFYALAKATNASLTITVTASGASTNTIEVGVYSGPLATLASVLDVSATKAGTSTTAQTSASITTTDPNDLILAFYGQDSASASLSADTQSFVTDKAISSDGANVFQYLQRRIVSSTGTYQDAFTSSASVPYTSIIAAFKAAASSGSYDPSWMMAILD